MSGSPPAIPAVKDLRPTRGFGAQSGYGEVQSMGLALEGLRVIDADTHLTEAHDLWTKRAPAKYAAGSPRRGRRRPSHVVRRRFGDGFRRGRRRHRPPRWQGACARGALRVDAGRDPPRRVDRAARIQVMDDSGIWAQVCFPNSIGLGGQGISDIVKDPVLRLLCVQVYNDAMAEVQADSGSGCCRCRCSPPGASTSAWPRPNGWPRSTSGAST